jgi:FG-GAP-like repeat
MLKPNPAQALPFDLNGDRLTDFYESTGDRNTVFLQTASGAFQSRSLAAPSGSSSVDTSWIVQGSGAFDSNRAGDGDRVGDDLLWRNFESGQVAISFGQGAAAEKVELLDNQSLNYFPKLADFNGDQITDILWSNPVSGETEIWLINANPLEDNAALSTAIRKVGLPIAPSLTANPELGDFNGDGQADILWQDRSTGQLNLWLLKEGNLSESNEVTLAGSVGNLTLADFNGDGRTDIFDRVRSRGSNRLWLWGADGLSPESAPIALPNSRPDGALSFGDLNGDGRTDILLQSPIGPVTTWLLQADGQIEVGEITGIGSRYIQQVKDWNGDGKVDLLLNSFSADAPQLWFLDGANVLEKRNTGRLQDREIPQNSLVAGSFLFSSTFTELPELATTTPLADLTDILPINLFSQLVEPGMSDVLRPDSSLSAIDEVILV